MREALTPAKPTAQFIHPHLSKFLWKVTTQPDGQRDLKLYRPTQHPAHQGEWNLQPNSQKFLVTKSPQPGHRGSQWKFLLTISTLSIQTLRFCHRCRIWLLTSGDEQQRLPANSRAQSTRCWSTGHKVTGTSQDQRLHGKPSMGQGSFTSSSRRQQQPWRHFFDCQLTVAHALCRGKSKQSVTANVTAKKNFSCSIFSIYMYLCPVDGQMGLLAGCSLVVIARNGDMVGRLAWVTNIAAHGRRFRVWCWILRCFCCDWTRCGIFNSHFFVLFLLNGLKLRLASDAELWIMEQLAHTFARRMACDFWLPLEPSSCHLARELEIFSISYSLSRQLLIAADDAIRSNELK